MYCTVGVGLSRVQRSIVADRHTVARVVLRGEQNKRKKRDELVPPSSARGCCCRAFDRYRPKQEQHLSHRNTEAGCRRFCITLHCTVLQTSCSRHVRIDSIRWLQLAPTSDGFATASTVASSHFRYGSLLPECGFGIINSNKRRDEKQGGKKSSRIG